MNSAQIRESFLAYFESQDHLRVTSSSLIPVGDPTLLLTSAGMVQFKPYFAGEQEPPNRRLTSSQKSFRTTDIDEVGDASHITMFEMLGNFSIGDYFKDGAMQFAIECLDQVMGLPKDRFAATVHHTDDEAYELWQKHGIQSDRIFRFGDSENWWGPAGDEGPTGPCAELHYDFMDDRPSCGLANCGPNCDNVNPDTGQMCERFLELWNLVFMQFYHNLDGSRPLLPSTGIDTGMGFERLAVILQDKRDIYETDLFVPLISKIEEISGVKYQSKPEVEYAMRVVAEHGRSASFLISDGVVPSNEGRGYVLRRLIRRAIRHARHVGLEDPFLGQVSGVVAEIMGDAYPELRNNAEFVQTVLKLEEEKFQSVFQNGYAMLSESIIPGEKLPGQTIFRLWDTFGFPPEMTEEIAAEKGIEADIAGFNNQMEEQRERARASAKFGGDRAKIRVYESLGIGGVKFLGYETLTASSVAVGIITGDEVVNDAKQGDEIEIALLETPFYAEGGGQVGDTGEMDGPNGKIEIHDTQRVMPDLIIHFGKVVEGTIAMGQNIDCYVNPVRREDTARNHTATHLLHAALRQVLGAHVRQAGSLVAPDRLRFDFSHVDAVTPSEMEQIQFLVNEKIRQNATVHKDEDSYTNAIKRGALAFFGDKYEDRVRLIEIVNGATFSFEVCGGTHVHQTGQLGSVFILGESSIGAGMRRIEAVSGRGAERVVNERLRAGSAVANKLQTTLPELEDRVESLLEDITRLNREKENLERQISLQSAADLLDSKQEVDGVNVLVALVDVNSADGMREIGDWLRDKLESGVVVLGGVINERPLITAMVTKDLVERGLDATTIVRGAAKAIGGGGGGRPDVAQAGGKQADKLSGALDMVPSLVREGLTAS